MIDDHATRVAMIKAVAGEQMLLDGRSVWGIFTNDFARIDYGGGVIAGRELKVDMPVEDQENAKRGSYIERANGDKFYCEAFEPYDDGMVRVILVQQQ